jgi:hypothetical protein
MLQIADFESIHNTAEAVGSSNDLAILDDHVKMMLGRS